VGAGQIPPSEVPTWIRSGRIGLVLLQSIPKFQKNIPSKMFEYWACGLPVIASDLPAIRQFLSPGQNGLLVTPGDSEGVARVIKQLLSRPDQQKIMGRSEQQQVYELWNNESQIDTLINFYHRIRAGRLEDGNSPAVVSQL